MNKSCPKDNFPTPYIDQIINECVTSEIFSFMDGFSRYNHIQIKLKDLSWGIFADHKIHFNLKNPRANFQWAMAFALHDLKRIIEVYLDDLSAHSCKRVDHPSHLRILFEGHGNYKFS